MANYTLEILNSKSIFEIRDIAKEVGVSAPTKSNKGELVDLILKITSGAIPPPIAPRRGRPKKSEWSASDLDSATANEPAEKAEIAEKAEKCEYEVSCNFENVNKTIDDKKSSEKIFASPKEFENKKPAVKQRFFGDKYSERSSKNERFSSGAQTLNEEKQPESNEQVREGILELSPDGYGFLRVKNGEFNEMDAYVNAMKIKQYGLRRGDFVRSTCKIIQDGKPAAVYNVVSVNGIDATKLGKRPNFDDLVPIYPNERIRLELPSHPRDYAIRCIDLVSPIGKGQRGIIVSPPKAGKTTLLKMIAESIAINYPEIELLVLLIDERPEEVTDMQRSIKGEVVFSTFDELPEHHTKTAEMLLDRAKRMVESGKDVVILMDSLTRLARAYNLTIPPTGRTLSGGIDPGALHSPKRFFGSARNIENGGSLTIIATALIDTGSRMDDVIFEEFKGTGNMEIHLDRRLSEKRVFPAIDLAKSGTRKEELLLTPSELEGTWGVRKMLSNGDSMEATENLLGMLVKTTSNREFVDQLNLQFKMFQKEGYTFRKQ
ncbi:MAG: transcription termination factor Rho [Clostridia bacterium]